MHPATSTRRAFLKQSVWAAASAVWGASGWTTRAAAGASAEPYFLTRGVVLVPNDLKGLDWPALAQQAGLTTLAMHGAAGPREFPDTCRQHGLQVEYELHAASGLLPRSLFASDPSLFRMDEKGRRTPQGNLCVHSEKALQTVCENTLKWAKVMRPTTGRYFFWTDDGQVMCRCEQCREFSDSDQAVLLENRMLTALRQEHPRATLAHLAYMRTLPAPTKVKPLPGVFLEFAPYSRQYDRPLAQRDVPGIKPGPDQAALGHGQLLDLLDANLEAFGRTGAQVLEYWLDLSRFVRLRPDRSLIQLPWHQDVFESDLKTYAQRGIRHVTSFGVRLDGNYVKQFGMPPILAYGAALRRWRMVEGKPLQDKA
jgi:hypothetical protein